MSRTLNEITQQIKTSFMGDVTLGQMYGFGQDTVFDDYFSLVSIENFIVSIVAFAIYIHEQLWSVFRNEINDEIAQSRVHTREWYRQKALGFMFGVPIVSGTDKFDTTGLTDAAIESAKVIKQAATVKLISVAGYGILRIKVATKQGDELVPVPTATFEAFRYYMNRHVVDAGTQIVMTTGTGDDVRFSLDIYYDPLIINPQGEFLTPDVYDANLLVRPAIKDFLQSIEFNGRLILSDLERHLRALPGVELAVIKTAASKYGQYTYDTSNIQNVGLIDEIRIADSGYFNLDENATTVNYKILEE